MSSLSQRFSSFTDELGDARAVLGSETSPNYSGYHARVLDIFCRMVAYAQELYDTQPKIRCTLPEELNDIKASFPELPNSLVVIPPTGGAAQYERQVGQALVRISVVLVQFFIDCICESLLVPCTECEDDGVLLACLTVCNGKIQKICNSVRQPVLSGPALQYWLQPLYDIFGDFLERLCCEFDLRGRDDQQSPSPDVTLDGAIAFNRSASFFNLARNVPTNSLSNLSNFALSQISQPSNTVSAVDFYNQDVSRVRASLARRNISVVERQAATTAEAYDLRMLTNMAWETIPSGSQVELVISPEGLVTCVRRLGDVVT